MTCSKLTCNLSSNERPRRRARYSCIYWRYLYALSVMYGKGNAVRDYLCNFFVLWEVSAASLFVLFFASLLCCFIDGSQPPTQGEKPAVPRYIILLYLIMLLFSSLVVTLSFSLSLLSIDVCVENNHLVHSYCCFDSVAFALTEEMLLFSPFAHLPWFVLTDLSKKSIVYFYAWRRSTLREHSPAVK